MECTLLIGTDIILAKINENDGILSLLEHSFATLRSEYLLLIEQTEVCNHLSFVKKNNFKLKPQITSSQNIAFSLDFPVAKCGLILKMKVL